MHSLKLGAINYDTIKKTYQVKQSLTHVNCRGKPTLPKKFLAPNCTSLNLRCNLKKVSAQLVPGYGGGSNSNGGNGGNGGSGGRGGDGNGDNFKGNQFLFALAGVKPDGNNDYKNRTNEQESDSESTEFERSGAQVCEEVVIENFPEGTAGFTKADLLQLLTPQRGQPFSHEELVADRQRLEKLLHEDVQGITVSTHFVDGKTNRQRVVYNFRTVAVDPAFATASFKLEGASLMPSAVRRRLCALCRPRNPRDLGAMNRLREMVEEWYASRGMPMCFISGFDDASKMPLATNQGSGKGGKGEDDNDTASESGSRSSGPVIRAFVTEPKVERVKVSFLRSFRRQSDRDADEESSDEGFEEGNGNMLTAAAVRDLAEHKMGQPYRAMDSQLLVNRLYGTGLVDDVVVEPEQLSDDADAVGVAVRVTEVPRQSYELDLDWSLPIPSLFSLFGRKSASSSPPAFSARHLVPGGSVSVTQNSLGGRPVALSASMESANWLNPSSDLGLALSYTDPFFAQGTSGNMQVFNTRKVSPMFTGTEETGEVPPVFVDRVGVKAWTSVSAAGRVRVDHALLLQAVTALDDQGRRIPRGTKVLRNGQYAESTGPPTALSGTGRDVGLSYQGYAALENVSYVGDSCGGAPAMVGSRTLVQVDQGLNPKITLANGKTIGLSGGLFNKIQASHTQYLDLTSVGRRRSDGSSEISDPDLIDAGRRAPPTLVLHAKAGVAVGALPPYEAFALGGPFSIRGFSQGEIGAAKRFVEAAAELRVPAARVPGFPASTPGTLYAFVDATADVGGSSRELPGNPTEFFRKPGSGWSYGVGLKALGAARFEYARDTSRDTWAFLINFGERF